MLGAHFILLNIDFEMVELPFGAFVILFGIIAINQIELFKLFGKASFSSSFAD
jgi:hypothetical protein